MSVFLYVFIIGFIVVSSATLVFVENMIRPPKTLRSSATSRHYDSYPNAVDAVDDDSDDEIEYEEECEDDADCPDYYDSIPMKPMKPMLPMSPMKPMEPVEPVEPINPMSPLLYDYEDYPQYYSDDEDDVDFDYDVDIDLADYGVPGATYRPRYYNNFVYNRVQTRGKYTPVVNKNAHKTNDSKPLEDDSDEEFVSAFLGEDVNTSENIDAPSNVTYSAVMEREKKIRSKYFGYIDSIDLSLKYPLMRDTSHPLIIELNHALSTAQSLRPESNVPMGSDAYRSAYYDAVNDLDKAFIAAEGTAKKMRENFMSIDEQKQVVTAQKLLAVAVNGASSPNERSIAYSKVLKIMENISMPATKKARLEIESAIPNFNAIESIIGDSMTADEALQ